MELWGNTKITEELDILNITRGGIGHILYDLEYNLRVVFVFGSQKRGFYSMRGLIEGGGGNKFRPKSILLCHLRMKYSLYCLLNMAVFIVAKLCVII